MPSNPNPDCSVSVIICTYNPRPDYLQRVLDALKAQTLPKEQWELLLIDNASREPLAGKWDLSWHELGRHIREDELGLTAARRRGIKEARGELLVFVDDDNVLAVDYLEQTIRIGSFHEFIGAWGGSIEPEFEIQPSEWTRRFWPFLAMRSVERSFWSNITTDYMPMPYGAGLTIRRKLAEAYARHLETDEQAMRLGRKGNELTACEDVDMVLTACDLGYGYGIFVELQLLHLIHQGRLSEDYLLRLVEGSAFSVSMLKVRRGGALPETPFKPWWRRKLGALRRRLMVKRIDRLAMEAYIRGEEKACAILIKTFAEVPGEFQRKPDVSAIPWRS
jgi:glycosyltransferase involved in cell wall biosynthesis